MSNKIHSLHKTKGTILFDDCQACTERASTLDIDDESLQWLADKAGIAHLTFNPEAYDLSLNERRAIANLRHMGRIVFKSGITEEVAR
jgi:hypothetical protein